MNEQELRRKLIARKLLLPSEAAFMVGKTKRTINRWIEAGLPGYVDPRDGQTYVRLADVHDWMRGQTTRKRGS